jgi:small conductance mechanosensitive channel
MQFFEGAPMSEMERLEHAKDTILDLIIRFGPKVLAALLVLAVGVLISRWVTQWLDRALTRIELEPPVRLLLARLTRLIVLGVFLIMALQNLGVELLPLIAGLSVVGAGLALATQGVLSNGAAGLSIIFTKPFRVGEYISIAGEEGRVEMITLFSTTLSHPDRSLVVIPNRKISGEILHNYGQRRQLTVSIAVAPGTDLSAAFAVVDEVLKANSRVLRDPPPLILTSVVDGQRISVNVMPWVAVPDYGAASSEVSKALIGAFREHGIAMPVPQREVRLLDKTA